MRRFRLGVVVAVGTVIAVTALVGGAGARAVFSATITAVPNGLGTITGGGLNCGVGGSVCYVTVTSSPVDLTATAATGWAFTGWEDDCSGATTSVCHLTLTNGETAVATADFDPSYPVNVTVNGNGAVTGSGGISCTSAGGAGCSKNFQSGDHVTLTAAPSGGATFTGWTGCPTAPSGVTCSFTMDSTPVNVSAGFSGGTTNRTLTVNVTGNGKITGGGVNCGAGNNACSEQYANGTTVMLTETPSSGAAFSGWSGSCSGTGQTCSVTMDANKTVNATFTGGSTFPLTVTVSGSGNVTGGGINCGTHGTTCSQNEPSGTSVTLAETPDGGAAFTGWTGACSGTGSTCNVSMTAAKTVGATFTTVSTNKVTLTLTVEGKGTVSAPNGSCSSGGGGALCSQQYTQGRTVTLTATPGSGASFSGWSGACSGTGACTLQMTTSRSATADFTGGFGLRSLGAPLSTRRGNTCAFTIRFDTSEAASAQLRVVRGGRTVETLVFSAPEGGQRFGPIGLGRGAYALLLKLTNSSGNARTLRWDVACGSGPFTPPGPAIFFRLTQGKAEVSRIFSGWLVNLHFRTNRAARVRVRVAFRGRLISDFAFVPHAGAVTVGPFFFNEPGAYRFTMAAVDSAGQARGLRWIIGLH